MFPDPSESWVEIGGVKTIPLEKLVELKLASGMTVAGRRKNLADVQELIRILRLEAIFAERLDPYVQAMFRELHAELTPEAEQSLAPTFDSGSDF